MKLLVAGFLLLHGLVHLSFLSSRPAGTPAANWPWELGSSWALSPLGLQSDGLRAIAIGLLVIVIAGYILAGLALAGVLSRRLWRPAIVIGSVASIAMLGAFFHQWLALGVIIDAVLLWVVLVVRWVPPAPQVAAR